MKFETDLHRAQGLGSAKKGVGHWIVQRITAIFLIPLGIWFMSSFIFFVLGDYTIVRHWMASSFNLTLLILFTGILFYHGYLGLQVIAEDYIPNIGTRTVLILFLKIFSLFMTVLAIICLIKLHLS